MGCVSGPANPAYSIKSLKGVPANDYGVVFGKICEAPGFEIKNVNTGKKILHIGGHSKASSAFAFQLPEGEYELESIAAGGPGMYSDEPYRFRVMPNKVLYVGSIVKSWSIYNRVPENLKCDSEIKRIISVRKYGSSPYFYGIKLRKKVNGDSPVYLSNDVEDALEAVKEKYPNFSFSNYEIKLMY